MYKNAMELSYYQATRRVSFEAPALAADIDTDVAVIGGGIAGVSAALSLAEAGYKVALLEARTIGWGASGRNGGQVLPGLAAPLHRIAQLVGREQANKVWHMSMEAVELLHARIKAHQIPCDPVKGYLHVALKPRQVRELHAEQEERVWLGAPLGRLLEGPDLYERIASHRYIAALEDRLAGHIHPLNYTVGLAMAARQAGALIYEQSPVIKIEQGKVIDLSVGAHKVRAKHLILAGGAYLNRLAGGLDGYIMPVGTYIVATESRPDIASLIPGNEAVADLNFVLDYFRRSPDDRMLFGGRVSYSTYPPKDLGPAMLKRAVAVFPQLKGVRAEFVWGGLVDITRNRAPHFGKISDNILFLQGFSGHGVALAGLAGQLAAEAVAGQFGRFDVFARIPHARFPGGRMFRTPALVLATSWYRLRDIL